MENYLHFVAINEAYGQFNIPLGLSSNFGDFDDAPAAVAQKVHVVSGSPNLWADLDANTREKKIANAKANLNNVAASLMTKERLDQVDPDGHVLGWFTQMKQLLNF